MRRIIYVSWPATEITGGIKMVFRHVEALRENGFAAWVATADAKMPGWFETKAPMIRLAELSPETDVLVFPENHVGLLEQFDSWKSLKVVFCQNPYMIFRGVGQRTSYADYGIKDIICVGQYVATFCRRRLPGSRLFIVPNYVERKMFRPQETKRLQIALMPRKRQLEAAVIRDLFQSDNPQYRNVPWVPIANVPEHEVARIFGESAVYLSLCRFEAFSLSLLEGLACGCITAGFTGVGGRECATMSNGFWAEEDDCLGCVDQLTQAVRLVIDGGDRYRHMVEGGFGTLDYFRRERFLANLLRCWRTLVPDALLAAT